MRVRRLHWKAAGHRWLRALGAVMLLLAAGSHQLPTSRAQSPAAATRDYQAAIDRLSAAVQYEVEAKGLPALSIAVVDGDQVVWAQGFGFQDAAQQTPASEHTVYRVGSVSKLFTDMAVMQLVEQGKLDLDAPVKDYLPDFQPQSSEATQITLRRLMTHRSGLVRESPIGNYFDPSEPSLAATVASLNDTQLVYPPGTRTKYSNAAIAVVGAVLERQLTGTHPEHVRASILDPLQMNASGFTVTPAMQPHLATGWMWSYDGRRWEAPTFLLGTGPAGNMYSSVVDLAKFMTCLFDEGAAGEVRIVQPETYRTMVTPERDEQGRSQEFGIGFHVQDFDGHTKVGHGGAVYGFSTQLEALPERRLGVVAAAALDGSNGVVRRLADYGLRLMLAAQDGKPLDDYRRTQAVPAPRATALVGRYHHADSGKTVEISQLNEQLYLHRGSFRYTLRAAVDDGQLLVDDALGFGTRVDATDDVLTIEGLAYHRQPSQPPPAAPPRWLGLIGEYGWDHNTLYILEDAGQLVALIEWFYYYPLTEIDENTFAFPDYGLYHGEQLHFSRDAQGRATQVTAAEVAFARRAVGTEAGETFKITPVRPIAELRGAAREATPPQETGQFREAELVRLTDLEPSIRLDIRYATTNNFTGAQFYERPEAFLQRPAAEAVVRAHRRLEAQGLGLLIHDAYRPWYVTKMFWDATPDELKTFVANPASGSRHNRGCAVDLTLYDRSSGEAIEMVAGYDEFSPRSFPLYPGGTARQRWYRQLLRETMEAEGFEVYQYEWWHFDYQDWRQYRIGNQDFSQVGS